MVHCSLLFKSKKQMGLQSCRNKPGNYEDGQAISLLSCLWQLLEINITDSGVYVIARDV